LFSLLNEAFPAIRVIERKVHIIPVARKFSLFTTSELGVRCEALTIKVRSRVAHPAITMDIHSLRFPLIIYPFVEVP
jgi:hypothetical protein